MGYFERKRDRGRDRELRRRLNEEASGVEWESIPDSPPSQVCFLRFSVRKKHEVSARRAGIFVAAYELLEGDELESGLRGRLRSCLGWFEDHLSSPKHPSSDRAIFFFKSEAHECIREIWELVHLLREAEVWADMQKLDRPGKVVYEDEHQIAVLPWREATSL